MVARGEKAELDKVLGFAQAVGYTVTTLRNGDHLVQAPGGESARVVGSPSGRNLRNQLAKLKNIGVPISKEELRRRKTQLTPDRPNTPEAAPVPALHIRFAPTPTRDATDPPAGADSPATAVQEKATTDVPDAPATRHVGDLATLTTQAAYESGDVSLLGYVLWRAIRNKQDVRPSMLFADSGVVWEGPLKRELKALFPDLTVETQQAVHKYVTTTENLHCVRAPRSGQPSLWWARDQWRQGDKPAFRFTPVRTTRYPEPRLSAGAPAPVHTRKVDPTPSPAPAAQVPVTSPPETATPPVSEEPAGSGPIEMTPQLVLAGVQALIDANAELAETVETLQNQVRLLRAQNAALSRRD